MLRLRDYQTEVIESLLDAMRRGVKSALVGLFTGAGKTVIFTALADRIEGRTLIIAPMRELVWQAADKVRQITDSDPDIEMADFVAERDYWPAKVVVASKQTLLSSRQGEKRYRRFNGFSLVIVDEAHLQCSDPVLEMLRFFQSQGAMVVGFSATPFRMDGKPLREFYEEIVCNYDLQWAIANGWSVPPICKISKVESLDLSRVTLVGGDFNQSKLQAELNKEANLHRACMICAEEMEGQTVLFAASVFAAQGACHFLKHNYGIQAVCVWGTMPDEERAEALAAFKSKQAKVLVNCQVVAVGFDYPPTATLIMARPTRSRSFWLQCVGRATRPLPGVVDFEGSTVQSRIAAIAASDKPHFKIVDCTSGALDHTIITSVDMFVKSDDPAVKAEVKGAAEKAPLTPEELAELAAKAAEKIASAKLIEEMRRNTHGRGEGRIHGKDVDITWKGVRSVGTYNNPLKGKYAGYKLSELPDHYVHWAAGNEKLNGWIKAMFRKELGRRHGREQRFVS
jgi:superfamily II DNA or RNA helicase